MAATLELAPIPVRDSDTDGCEDRAFGERLFTRDEYLRLGEFGILRPEERVELIRGRILTMPPQDEWHIGHTNHLRRIVENAFGPGYFAFEEKPIVMPNESEPEPDVAVVRGKTIDYLSRKATGAEVLLLVEVADLSLGFDRRTKASLYAEGGVQEYWILNRKDLRLEVFREPGEVSPGAFGYNSIQYFHRGQKVSPLAKPDSVIQIDDLLPRAPEQIQENGPSI